MYRTLDILGPVTGLGFLQQGMIILFLVKARGGGSAAGEESQGTQNRNEPEKS